MGPHLLNSPVVSMALLSSLAYVLAIDPSAVPVGAPGEWHCNFNDHTRTYNSSDLLLCLNELAANILQPSTNLHRITDRGYQDTRQSYSTYPFAPDYSTSSNGAGSSNYYGYKTILSLLPKLALPNLSNLFQLSGFNKPSVSFFRALSSIAQYDDLQCIPRILCEVSSGSIPRNFDSRQIASFQNFESNALFGLLSAFSRGQVSPILIFGKAALLGLTHRGDTYACFREYPRCPRRSDQLIYYLNNYKGGFFRLFGANLGGSIGSYYPLQQNLYHQYNVHPGIQYRITESKTQNPSAQSFVWSEAEEGNIDNLENKLSTDNIDNSREQNKSVKVVFPKD